MSKTFSLLVDVNLFVTCFVFSAVLKVPARQVCGYDPCNGESCQDNPNARCLVTSKCRPVFVNAFNERIRKCEGNEVTF